MQQQPFNKQFADRFREEWIYCPCFEEQAFEELRFKQFAGVDKEVPAIGYKLLERISDASIIKGIMVQLEQKAIPEAFNLSHIIQGMQKTFQSYIGCDPYDTNYIQELLNHLQSFYSLTSYSQKKMEYLMNKLEWVLVAAMNAQDRKVFYHDLENIKAEVALCKNEIDIFYNYFYSRLNEKTDHVHRISLTSQVDLYLLQLVSYAEIMINTMEDLQLLWAGWHLTRLILESQEMYN